MSDEASAPSAAARPLPILQLKSNGSGRGSVLALSALDLDEPSVEQSFEITATALTMKGYRIDANGIRSGDTDPGLGAAADRFVPFGTLGKGASGTVTKALKTSTGQVVALKSIGVHVQAQRHQLMQELDTYASLSCPYIVGFHGAFYTQGSTVLILEYMNRGSLQQVLDTVGPLPEPVLRRIAKQVLGGLRHMHVRRKLHRDIKPANILLNSAGQAKLADFGIARELGDLMNAQTFIGTQVFMSPERIQSQPYGHSADIWSFGLTLATCAIGRFPYHDADKGFIHVFQTITKDPPPVLPRSRFSVGFRNLLSKCLNKDPDQRWSAERLLSHPWLNGSDLDDTQYRWPWETAPLSSADIDDLDQVAAIVRDGQCRVDYDRLAASLNLPTFIVRQHIESVRKPAQGDRGQYGRSVSRTNAPIEREREGRQMPELASLSGVEQPGGLRAPSRAVFPKSATALFERGWMWWLLSLIVLLL